MQLLHWRGHLLPLLLSWTTDAVGPGTNNVQSSDRREQRHSAGRIELPSLWRLDDFPRNQLWQLRIPIETTTTSTTEATNRPRCSAKLKDPNWKSIGNDGKRRTFAMESTNTPLKKRSWNPIKYYGTHLKSCGIFIPHRVWRRREKNPDIQHNYLGNIWLAFEIWVSNTNRTDLDSEGFIAIRTLVLCHKVTLSACVHRE